MTEPRAPQGPPYPQPPPYSPQAPYPPAQQYPPMQQAYPPTQQAYPSAPNPGYGQPQGYHTAYQQQPTQQRLVRETRVDIDVDAQNVANEMSGFSEKSIRLAFIKKVFAILVAMLVVTAAIMCLFMFVEDIREYAKDHIWLYITAIVIYMVAAITLICLGDIRRKVPYNFIFLAIITCSMGVMLGCIATTYEVKEVLIAVGIVTLITIGMMALGFQNKFDFTFMTGAMVACTFGLLGFGIFALIFQSEILYMFYATLGAILFSLWIVFDVQLMLGGKHKFSISPEEYIVAALNLYLDIINLLMYVLLIIGIAKD